MSQGPLCPNLTQKVQKEVSQIANRNLSRMILLGGLSVNLNHLKTKEKCKNINGPLQDTMITMITWGGGRLSLDSEIPCSGGEGGGSIDIWDRGGSLCGEVLCMMGNCGGDFTAQNFLNFNLENLAKSYVGTPNWRVGAHGYGNPGSRWPQPSPPIPPPLRMVDCCTDTLLSVTSWSAGNNARD